jgi:hypothetical protein
MDSVCAALSFILGMLFRRISGLTFFQFRLKFLHYCAFSTFREESLKMKPSSALERLMPR